MRVHTTLSGADMFHLADRLPVTYTALTGHGSSVRPGAFEVRLSGSGGRTNSGRYGAGDEQGATWDEWGAWFGRLFIADESALVGTPGNPIYDGREHYNWATGHRFNAGTVPADSHPRHRWDYKGESPSSFYVVHECRKCSALTRRLASMTWAQFQDATLSA